MNWMVNQCKVKAAARSMHQFLPAVRSIFGQDVDAVALETATVFLYVRVAKEVFGRRFSDRLCGQLSALLRYISESEARVRISRLSTTAEAYLAFEQASHPDAPADEQFRFHVRSAIKSMFDEAGLRSDDDARVRDGFAAFEDAARRIKTHMLGIKRQNRFVMS